MLFISRNISGLPYDNVNRRLSVTLRHDTTHISIQTIRHIRARHPDHFTICMAALEQVIAMPDYVGQSPLHPENFVLIKEVEEQVILVALSTVPNESGNYPVQSAYIIDHHTFQRRIRKGYFRPL